MGKVYVVQEPHRRVTEQDIRKGFHKKELLGQFVPVFDITPAAEYGEIELLIDSSVHIGIAMKPVAEKLRVKLRDFCDDDFILPTGDPAAIGIAIAIAAKYNDGRVNLLRWDRKMRGYIKLAVAI